MREGGRLKKKEREIERERRWSETDVPKLYTYNEYELSVTCKVSKSESERSVASKNGCQSSNGLLTT